MHTMKHNDNKIINKWATGLTKQAKTMIFSHQMVPAHSVISYIKC